MKAILNIISYPLLIVVVFCIIAGGYKLVQVANDRETIEFKDAKLADDIVSRIKYIKDSRTNICFAYMWKGYADGGPALATVPEELIPKDLLIIGNVKK